MILAGPGFFQFYKHFYIFNRLLPVNIFFFRKKVTGTGLFFFYYKSLFECLLLGVSSVLETQIIEIKKLNNIIYKQMIQNCKISYFKIFQKLIKLNLNNKMERHFDKLNKVSVTIKDT